MRLELPIARLSTWLLASLIAAATAPLSAQNPLQQQLDERFQAELSRLVDTAAGVAGVSVIDLTDGRRFGVNDAQVFTQGSAIKIPILIELYRRADAGDLSLTEQLPLRAADRVGGTGLLQYLGDGESSLSLGDLAIPMIVLSDNMATNMLIDRLGMDRVTQTMAGLGAANTRLQRKMIRPEDSMKGRENLSTPREAAELMARLARCDLPMRQASCADVRRVLEIPKSGSFRDPIPSDVRVAWKPGGLEGVATAWGLVDLPGRPYAAAVMVNYGAAGMADTVRALSAATYRYFTQIARTTPYGTRVPLDVVEGSR